MLATSPLKQNRYGEAETELSQAAALQSQDLNTLVIWPSLQLALDRSAERRRWLAKNLPGPDVPAPAPECRHHYLLGKNAVKAGKREEASKRWRLRRNRNDTRGHEFCPAAEAR